MTMQLEMGSQVALRAGTVEKVAGSKTLIDLGSERVWADAAMAVEYQAEPGDQLLVIGSENDWFVIGVLHGRGKVRINGFSGVDIGSAVGEVRLSSGKEISISAPAISMLARGFRGVFETMTNTAKTLVQKVSGSQHISAGQSNTVVKGVSSLNAERVLEKAEKEVRIDGSSIHLG